jgi:hypothetical protein
VARKPKALAKINPELIRQWNETKDRRVYTAKGIGFDVRQLLQRQAKQWRDEVGTEAPDLTSLDELESLASAVGIPFEQWEKFTAGELFALALERYGMLTSTEARNKFCFEQWQAGKTLKELNAALKRHPDWDAFEDDKAVRSAINSWARRIGVRPRKGQRGRRPK